MEDTSYIKSVSLGAGQMELGAWFLFTANNQSYNAATK